MTARVWVRIEFGSLDLKIYKTRKRGIDTGIGIIYDTAVEPRQIVIDTSVLIAGLQSKQGASYKLLQLVDSGLFEINLSVPLVLEYEDVANRRRDEIGLSARDIDDILDYLCQIANLHKIHYLWRPFLDDPEDDMVLELAVAARCKYIVTFNLKHFAGIEQFGIRAILPQEFLRRIGGLA